MVMEVIVQQFTENNNFKLCSQKFAYGSKSALIFFTGLLTVLL